MINRILNPQPLRHKSRNKSPSHEPLITNSNQNLFTQSVNLTQLRQQLINVCKTRSVQDPIVVIMKKLHYENTYLKEQVRILNQQIHELKQANKKPRKQNKSSTMRSIKYLEKQTINNLYDFIISATDIKENKSSKSIMDSIIERDHEIKEFKNNSYDELVEQLEIKQNQIELWKNKYQDLVENQRIKQIQLQKLLQSERDQVQVLKQVIKNNTLVKDSSVETLQSHSDCERLKQQNMLLKQLHQTYEQEIRIQKEQIEWLGKELEHKQGTNVRFQQH